MRLAVQRGAWRSGTLLKVAVLGIVLLIAAAARPAAAQAPVYFTSHPDAVTGSLSPISIPGNTGTKCKANDRCWVPAPGADSYGLDAYERPFGKGGKATDHFPEIDIIAGQVGFDEDWLYYRIDLFATAAGGLPSHYGFELNFDADDRGDMLIAVTGPGSRTSWSVASTIGYFDSNDNVGRAVLDQHDSGGNPSQQGYDTKVWDSGNNTTGAGGNDAVLVRVAPDRPASVELAVKRIFLEALAGGPVSKASFRPYAGKSTANQQKFYYHDEYTREGLGSPYPWLQLPGAPRTCQTEGLTPEQRAALDSGTDSPTPYINPCYEMGMNEFDMGAGVGTLTDPGGIQFDVDLGITKTVADSVVIPEDTIVYTLVVTNHTSGSGEATGVVVTDSLPVAGTFLSASPSQGTCSEADRVVSCDLGSLANGASSTVTLRFAAPAALDAAPESVGPDMAAAAAPSLLLTNVARVRSNSADSVPANDRASVDLRVVEARVSAWADSTGIMSYLPGNAVPQVLTYQVANESGKALALDVLAAASNPAVIVIDSVRGPALNWNARADSARTPVLEPGMVVPVSVWFRVTGTDAGDSSRVGVTARLTVRPGVNAIAWVETRVIRASLAVVARADASEVQPGTDVSYTIELVNDGPADVHQLQVLNEIPPEVQFRLGSLDSTLPAEIDVVVEYSNDHGSTWTYTPVSGGCGAPAGYDGCVTTLRWRLPSALGAESAAGALLRYTGRVR